DLINNTGLINADFADVSTVMTNKGLSLMGTGTASGPERALKAARQAISSPLLEDVSINGATGIIINITGDASLTTHETNQAVTLIMEAADEDAEIIFGTVIDENMGENVKVTVIATGLVTPRKEAQVPFKTEVARPAPTAPSFEAPAAAATPAPTPAAAAPVRHEARTEPVRTEARPELNTDYAVKSEMTFALESESKNTDRPKINWAEKLQ